MKSQLTTLPNQLRIASLNLKDRDSVAIGVWVGVGGRFENTTNNGVAHFLEHMVFRGSQNYTCDDIKRQIEGVGGSINAFTGDEQTCFYAKVPAKYLKRTLDVLTDMVAFANLTKKDFDREKPIILEEIKMYNDLPQYAVIDRLDEMLWPNHSLGRNLAGTLEGIAKMSVKDLRGFYQQTYGPANIVVSVVGACDHKALVNQLSKKFKKSNSVLKASYDPVQDSTIKSNISILTKPIEQVHLALGMHAYPIGHAKLPALAVLNTVLGGNMSSRLFDELREKRGLAYSVSSSPKAMYDTGAMVIKAGLDPSKLLDAAKLIKRILNSLARTGITQDELKRAREYFLGQLTLQLEDNLDQMFWMGESLFAYDRIRLKSELEAKIKKVTRKDVLAVAKELFTHRSMCLSVIGNVTKAQEKALAKLFA